MKSLLSALIVLLCWPAFAFSQTPAPSSDAGAPPAAAPLYDPFHQFINASVKSPLFYIEALGAGIIDQTSRFPTEWDSEDHAFAKRSVARLGQAFVGDLIEHGTGNALHHRIGA